MGAREDGVMKEDEALKKYAGKKTGSLREKAEAMVDSSVKTSEELFCNDAKALLHELRVHQAELEMQNEELKSAQRELEKSRAKYVDLYDFAPVGYFSFNEEGIITEANLCGAEMLGADRQYLAGKPFAIFVAPESKDIFYLHLRRVFEGLRISASELKLIAKNGHTFHALMEIATGDERKGWLCRVAIADISRRMQAEEQLKTSLGEKDALLKEVYHRVKNNMQLISSLLSLQSNLIADPHLKGLFRECTGRIKSMSLVHEMLYQSGNLEKINFGAFIDKLVAFLFSAHGRRGLSYRIEADEVALNLNLAIPCALIINELISNAFKHAFPEGRNGEISIVLKVLDGQMVRLRVRDNGVGLPQGTLLSDSPTLGFSLIHSLAEQLDGRARISTEGETCIVIEFPVTSSRSAS
jgi:two-component system, sensor histidine kinase PdtaS